MAIIGPQNTSGNARPWLLCLTETQKQKLFPDGGGPPPKLSLEPGARVDPAHEPVGCGTYACVWPDGKDVVKITSDGTDVTALELGQKVKRVMRVKETFKLTDAGHSLSGKPIPIYAVRGEFLGPLPEKMATWNRRFITQTDKKGHLPTLARRLLITTAVNYNGRKEDYKVDSDVRDLAKMTACKLSPPEEKPDCITFTDQFLDTFQDLFRLGIFWSDHHWRNMGVDKSGYWKVLDIGQSSVPVTKNIKPLDGVELGRIRRMLKK